MDTLLDAPGMGKTEHWLSLALLIYKEEQTLIINQEQKPEDMMQVPIIAPQELDFMPTMWFPPERKNFGPGRNQRKRRKLARQSNHPKWRC